MSDLVVRHIPFEFDGVEFIWNRSNPEVSVAMNALSFWVIGLERYLVKTMKDADAVITDSEVRQEARLFLQQESVHTSCHRRHVKALIEQYPGLQAALDKAVAHYDTLHADSDLPYLLAYAAASEGTFTAFFKMMIIDNRQSLFGDGDARVASLCLWHFCEEIEHRSSAVMVYDHVVGDPYYKVRSFVPMLVHVMQCHRMLHGGSVGGIDRRLRRCRRRCHRARHTHRFTAIRTGVRRRVRMDDFPLPDFAPRARIPRPC